MKRPIEKKDQEPIARLIRSVFEEYGAPLVNTVYDDPRTWHIYESLEGVNAGYTHLYIESFPEFADAVKMYARHGFVEQPSRLGHSGHTATTIHMELEL